MIGVLHPLKTVFGVLFSIVTTNVLAHNWESLTFHTERYPPANFVENDQITGYSVDILSASLKAVGFTLSPSQMHYSEWGNSYQSSASQPNSVLFSTARTPRREKLFKWVGPITKIKVVVFARANDKIVINTPLDMTNYRIGIVRDDVGEQLLLDAGVPRNSMQEAANITKLAEQLLKNRIDLLVYGEKSAYWWGNKAGLDFSSFESVFMLGELELFYAFNHDSDVDLIESLQQGLDLIKTTKTDSGETEYQAILNQYE